MTDKTDIKEREAFVEWVATEFVADHASEGLRASMLESARRAWQSGDDMAVRAFKAGRASLAACAGSEPVAQAKGVFEFWWADHMPNATQAEAWREWCELMRPGPVAVTHPSPLSPPGGIVGGWIALPGALPEPGTPVLLDIGKKYPIRAMWAAKHTVQAADDDTDWGEYDEATETYYCPEGWYEWNEHEDTNWAVSATPRAWAPLPPTTSAGSGKGE